MFNTKSKKNWSEWLRRTKRNLLVPKQSTKQYNTFIFTFVCIKFWKCTLPWKQWKHNVKNGRFYWVWINWCQQKWKVKHTVYHVLFLRELEMSNFKQFSDAKIEVMVINNYLFNSVLNCHIYVLNILLESSNRKRCQFILHLLKYMFPPAVSFSFRFNTLKRHFIRRSVIVVSFCANWWRSHISCRCKCFPYQFL